MEKFKHNNTEYEILDSYNTNGTENYQNIQVKKTTVTIVKTIFTFFPIFKHGKFSWFKKSKIRFRLFFIRTKEFDDGLTYQFYWDKWKSDFVIEEIID